MAHILKDAPVRTSDSYGIKPAIAAVFLVEGDVAEAERQYRIGLEWAERERCPIEAGRCHQGLAEIAIRKDDINTALDHFDKASALFQRHGARLFLDQVIRRRLELQGVADADPSASIFTVSQAVRAEKPNLSLHAAEDGTVTLMFSDIEDSTALNESMGDARWMDVLHAHNAVIEREVAAHGGRVVKTIGDGYMVVFSSAESGVRCALAVQAALGTSNSELGTSIRVRIGLHTGPVVREGSDFFGREVNFAARVASAASGGEVLVSTAVRERVAGAVTPGPARRVAMKGFDGAQEVWPIQT
jgi:class 3 adenylate cyclase